MLEIIVIESRFVYIGYTEPYDCPKLGKCVKIRMAYNIERWGTTEGLGQLANVGKQKDTRLRFTGTVNVPIGKILHCIEVEQEASKTFGIWNSKNK